MEKAENEVSSHDRINMTEFRLEFDQNFFTIKNVYTWTWPKIFNHKCLQLKMTAKFNYNIYFFTTTNLNVEFDKTMTMRDIKCQVQ